MRIDPAARSRWKFLAALLGALLVVAIIFDIVRPQRPVKPEVPAPVGPTTADLFTSIPADTLPIAWNAWSDESFAAAHSRGVPVVVLLTASWCESCILYEGALALRSDLRARLERDVVAVRTDIDRRPDVNARYRDESYALPTWIFLTPAGEVWDLADAPRPEALARLLDELLASPRAARRDPGLQALQPPPRPASPHLAGIAARIQADLVAAWPAAGVPLDATTPLLDGEALGFLAMRAGGGDVAARTFFLDGMRRITTLVDAACGCIEQDYEPIAGRVQRARFLDTHAMLLDLYATAWEMTRDSLFARTADGIAHWTQTTLLDAPAGLFRSAQGTLVMHEGRPAVTSAERGRVIGHAGALEPHVAAIYPTPGNARLAAALLRWGSLRADPAMIERARHTLTRLQRAAAPLPPHDWTRTGDALVASPHTFLHDGAELGLAWLAADERDIAAVRRVADAMIAQYEAPNGAFADVAGDAPETAPERMRVRMTPLAGNARAAQFLIALATVTGEIRYAAAAQRALEAWSHAVRQESPWAAASFGSAVTALTTSPLLKADGDLQRSSK